MTRPIILCGLGRLGWNVLATLRAANLNIVVIDQKRPPETGVDHVTFLQGDIRDRTLLERAGVMNARAVILATSDDLANVAAALQVRSMAPGVRIVIRMFNQNLMARLGKTLHNVVALSVSALTAPLLALIAVHGEALGNIASDGERWQIAELTLGAESRWLGQDIAALREAAEGVIVALGRHGQGLRVFTEAPSEHRLALGDRVILCSDPAAWARLRRETGEDDDSLQWASARRRFGRILWRTLSEIDTPVKICVSVLLIVVFLSTLVFHWGMDRTIPDGLYATISVLATGADLGGSRLPEGWQKVFVSVLRVLGVAVMASFTAIITNYLLRVRLGGVLEIRRIPEAGHVVVCGLGNVGFRVTEELVKQGEQVVVIESNPNAKFGTTARELGAAVIQADATLLQVQKQANAGTAKAVVAATNDPLVNLEVALLTRELNPKQRVVVRMADPALATTLREAANVRLAFSTTALAAPAFVAAVFGDRVLNIFLIERRVFAAVDLRVLEADAGLIGRTVSELTRRHHTLAIRMLRDGQRVTPFQDEALRPGDALLLVVELPNLPGLLTQGAETAAERASVPQAASGA
ncbi:MAG: NAD-binding protein [Gemmataceae bacterium]